MKELSQTSSSEILQYGRALLTWQVDEYLNHERPRSWYVIGAILSVALIIYAIATANFLFAVIILMAGLITLFSTFQSPDRIEVILTTTGVVVGDAFYEFKSMKNFSIIYEPPEIKVLYLDFLKPWMPLLSVPLEEMDPNRVREILLSFCEENITRQEESLTDLVRRLYKL
ncbi:MAG: hypothetical protein UU48_C0001G0059 [Candidatus Uhrbacteria bacterium GW2011_GWF2_41_16]|jgi:hypothetical protein|uniref:DUF5673 domain-containing protein n=2 Tax=Candidatus Uhriibacteriota TaxID=1752732 RepID=A0A0G0VCV8_9BACT|nr:MAG: hypothetical protein UU31_C0002G0130 [Candidatus Uhrbacteria bacterium GW2011_GWA2_41_10]KKR87765.1 MAG: hypothetical protein UU35_C0001G0046 [Candidatus Uhrbacteria bacterium GW2011_GWC2_41_11]KKR98704.1 MAG: hypothetical protein UU48_C0001G0059 [Candidatus Uhrbacteria bacterium GW2011_GWF2_41_16]HBP00200.1 hypothetical protein [Candidatus Uhrbacteria bacterium]